MIRRDGYLSEGSDDDVESAGRIRYKFQPNDAVSLIFNTDYAHLGGRGSGSVWLPRPLGENPWEATTTLASNAYLHSFLPLGPLEADQEPDSFQDSSFFNTSAQLDWNMGIATDRVEVADDFMSGNTWILNAGPLAFFGERVAMAHSARVNLDPHFTRTGHGNIPFHHLEVRSRRRDLHRSH